MSFKGYRWRYLFKERKPSPERVRRHGLLLAQLLENRGLSLPSHLLGRKRSFHISDLEKAASRILDFVKKDLPILIFGDYDVDGLTSTALFYKTLKRLGAKKVLPYVPERSEGYGLSPKLVETFAKYSEGKGLIVALDNGTKEVETVKRARELGLEVVIFDHHTPDGKLPEATIVNPKVGDGPKYLKDLSTVGLVYLFAKHLEKLGFSVEADRYLDLVALGTVADVSPLSELNALFVREGLKLLSEGKSSSVGLSLLAERLSKWSPFSEHDIAFRFAPRLNAYGRMENAKEGLKFLITEREEVAKSLLAKMDELNRRRKKLAEMATKSAIEYFEKNPSKALVYISDRLTKGILGIVAGRITASLGVPSVVFASDGKVAVGSSRSPEGLNIVEILKKLSPLLLRWGGHSQAAGLSVSLENFEAFKEAFLKEVEDFNPEPPTLDVDFPLSPLQVRSNRTIGRILKLLSPYGAGNPYPTFVFDDVLVDFKRTSYGYKLRFRENGDFFLNLEREQIIPPSYKGRKVRVVFSVRNADTLDMAVEDFKVLR